MILAPEIVSVMLVVEADCTPVRFTESATSSLERIGARTVGVVLNCRRSCVLAALQATR